MFIRFIDIINALNSLDKIYTNHELVYKVLRYLPKIWEAKMTAIQEVKDLTTLSMEELICSLTTHELNMHQKEKEESKRKKTIAFKSIIKFEESDESEDDDDEKESEDENENLMLLIRRFKQFLKKKCQRKRKIKKMKKGMS